MRMNLFEYVCDHCGTTFKAPVLLGDYGTLHLRSTGAGNSTYVDAAQDEVFDEVARFVDNIDGMFDLHPLRRSDIMQAAFGFACDPDIDGSGFVISGKPRCPNCGHHRIRTWHSIEPPEFVDLDVPHVTHNLWSVLTVAERAQRVRRAVEEALGRGL